MTGPSTIVLPSAHRRVDRQPSVGQQAPGLVVTPVLPKLSAALVRKVARPEHTYKPAGPEQRPVAGVDRMGVVAVHQRVAVE